jgi:hypothetical protein
LIAASSDPVERLRLRPVLKEAEQRERLQRGTAEFNRLEEEFVKYAAPYSKRLGLTFSDWRSEGVPPSVLRRSGLQGKAANGHGTRAKSSRASV